jgi:hypothetical protein
MKALKGTLGVWALSTAFAATMGFTVPGYCEEKDSVDKAKQVLVEADKIRNPDSPFKIMLSAEGDKEDFKVGDTLTLKFKSTQDAHLTLLDISTDGTVSIIFPNKWHESGKIEKDKEYTFPPADAGFVFRIKGPAGLEHIKAIASIDPVINVSPEKVSPAAPIPVLQDAEEAMKKVDVELKKRDAKTWAESEMKFEIKEAKDKK